MVQFLQKPSVFLIGLLGQEKYLYSLRFNLDSEFKDTWIFQKVKFY